MEFQRNMQPYILRIYLPTGVMVLTSWISFLVKVTRKDLMRNNFMTLKTHFQIDPHVVPGGMALLVTLLLVLFNVLLNLDDVVPVTGSVTAIEAWVR